LIGVDGPIVSVGFGEDYFSTTSPVIASMLARTHETIHVDLTASSPDLEEMVGRIHEAVRSLATRGVRPAILGYGLGSCAALMFVARNPGAGRCLALVAGWIRPPAKMLELASLWHMTEQEGAGSARWGVQSVELVMKHAENWDAPSQTANIPLIASALGRCGTVDLAGLLEQVEIPTLVVGCTRDEFATLAQSRLLFGGIENARYVEIDAGHAVLSERPFELLDHLERFMDFPTEFPPGSVLAPEPA
jgi:pimeloyl-ACP methyl ester carboxylesterase